MNAQYPDAPSIDLFSIDYQRINQLESWLKITPEKIRTQREIVLEYIRAYPLSTYEEIHQGLNRHGVRIKQSAVVRALSNLKYEINNNPELSPLDLTHSKNGATAYRLK